MQSTWQFGVFFFFLFYSSVDAAECVDRLTTCYQVQHLCDHLESEVREDCRLTCGVCTSKDEKCVNDQRCPTWFSSVNCTSDTSNEWRRRCPRLCGLCQPIVLEPMMKVRSSSPHRSPTRSPKRHRNPKQRAGSRASKRPRLPDHELPHHHQPRPMSPNANFPHDPSRESNEPKLPFFAERLNKDADPCIDFYDFACGNYKTQHPIQSDEDFFSLLKEQRDWAKSEQMKMIATEAHQRNSKEEKEMKRFWSMCFYHDPASDYKPETLWTSMQAIARGFPVLKHTSVPGPFDFGPMLHEMTAETGENFLYRLGVIETSKNKFEAILRPLKLIVATPNFYFDGATGETNTGYLHKYVLEIVRMVFTDHRIQDPAEFEAHIKEVLDFDRQLAQTLIQHQEFPVKKLHVTSVTEIVHSVNWTTYFLLDPLVPREVKRHLWKSEVLVNVESATHAIDEVLTRTKETNSRLLANYFFVRFLLHHVPYLDERFVRLHHEFNHQVYDAPRAPERQVTCYNDVMRYFGVIADHLYVMRWLKKTNMHDTTNMITLLRKSMGQVLKRQDWMTSPVKKRAYQKLKAMHTIWKLDNEVKDRTKVNREYAGLGLLLGDSYVKASAKVKQHRAHKVLMQVIGPEHVLLRHRPATDVHVLNDLGTNSLFLTSPLLQEPFYNLNQVHSMNFGLLGFLVARELTHAVDQQGSLHDAAGALNDWWDDETKRKFSEQADFLSFLYAFESNLETETPVNAERINRENIADDGGIRVSFEAYKPRKSNEKPLPGYSYNRYQSFFISYASLFCSHYSDKMAREFVKTSVYAPVRFRVNTVLANYDEFARAFNCEPDMPMNPTSKYTVWEEN